jgi:hypothetical protein
MTRLMTFAMLLASSIALADGESKQIKDMDCLVGSWKGTGAMAMGADKASLKASLDCARTSGGWGVQCSLHLAGVPGMASYEETDLFGWEPNTAKYHWYAVSNAGETHDHVTDGPSGNTLMWQFKGLGEGGKPFVENVKFTFSADSKQLAVLSETVLDGKSQATITFDLRK